MTPRTSPSGRHQIARASERPLQGRARCGCPTRGVGMAFSEYADGPATGRSSVLVADGHPLVGGVAIQRVEHLIGGEWQAPLHHLDARRQNARPSRRNACPAVQRPLSTEGRRPGPPEDARNPARTLRRVVASPLGDGGASARVLDRVAPTRLTRPSWRWSSAPRRRVPTLTRSEQLHRPPEQPRPPAPQRPWLPVPAQETPAQPQ